MNITKTLSFTDEMTISFCTFSMDSTGNPMGAFFDIQGFMNLKKSESGASWNLRVEGGFFVGGSHQPPGSSYAVDNY